MAKRVSEWAMTKARKIPLVPIDARIGVARALDAAAEEVARCSWRNAADWTEDEDASVKCVLDKLGRG